MSVDELAVDAAVDVDVWLGRMRALAVFEPDAASIDDLDGIAPHLNSVGGLVSSLRARCAARRVVLADAATDQGRPPVDSGDPEGGHGKRNKQSRRASAKDRERAATMNMFPALRHVLEAGDVGVEHVDVVTAVLRDLTVAQQLVVRDHGGEVAVLATANSPETFRSALLQYLARLIQEDGVRRLERQRANTRLSVWVDPITKVVKVYGEYDPERGAILAGRLQAGLDTIYALPIPDGCPDDPTAKNDHLRALALLAMVHTGAVTGTPASGGPDQSRIDMVVVIDHDTLRTGLHDHSIIDAGPGIELPVETLRRMACCANIIPAVLGSNGVILDQGRETRLANRRQRRALRAMYPTCAIAGCHTRFDHCEPHHIRWWTRDLGPTDLSNLIPLCDKHHHLVHEGGWLLALDPATRVLTVTFPDGTTTDMPPPRNGWNRNGGEQPGESDGQAGRGTSAHDRAPGGSAVTGPPTSTGASRGAASPAPARTHPEPEPEPPPEPTLWAS